MVHKKATGRIESDKLRVFVVWLPRYPGDNRSKAVSSMSNVPDARGTHFWDSNASLAKQYGVVLGLPEGSKFAWDTYMAFDVNATWNDAPPKPIDWMHQLSQDLGREHPRWLNSDQFRKRVMTLLSGAAARE